MLRALLWKEWRVQRPLVFSALAIAGTLPLVVFAGISTTTSDWSLFDLVDVLLPVYAMLVWPLFAVVTAASSIAGDSADGSIRMLLSRPVPAAVVWSVKLVTAAGALCAIVVVTGLVVLFLEWIYAGMPARYLYAATSEIQWIEVPAVVLVLFLLFASAFYCSTLAGHPLRAAVGGVALAVAISLAVGFPLWVLLVTDVSPVAFRTGVIVAIVVAGVGMLVAGFRGFVRRGFLEPARYRFVKPMLLVSSTAFIVAAVPATLHLVQLTAKRAAYNVGDLHISNQGVIVPQLTDDGLSTALVRRSVDGDSLGETLVARGATHPVTSPNGEWVVYVAYSPYPKGRGAAAYLRAVRSGGLADHAISGALEGWRPGFSLSSLRIAPDNDRVAYMHPGHPDLVIASISGTPEDATVVSIRSVEGEETVTAGVIGWSNDVPSELLFYRVLDGSRVVPSSLGPSNRVGRETRRSELRALDPATLRSRVVHSFGGSQRLGLWATRVFGYGAMPDRNWSWLPVWITEPGDDVEILRLVDVQSGATMEVTDSPCPNWGFSTANDRFLFATCSEAEVDETARVEIRELELTTRQEEVLVVLEGFLVNSLVRGLLGSPGNDRIALFGREGYARPYGLFIVDRNGEVKAIDVRGFPVRWLNDREILILGPFGPNRLQRVDVDTGVVRTIFP